MLKGGNSTDIVLLMFTSAEKLYVCRIKTREREKGWEKEKETDLKLKKTFQLL